MNELIKRFILDKPVSSAVYSQLLESFLKKKSNQDVHVLAASRLAVDFLNDAWQEMESLQTGSDKKSDNVQVGL